MSSPATGRVALSIVVWSLSAVLLFLGVATLRAVLDGERELSQSDAAFDANDLYGSIQHARRAASAYAPGAPHVGRGYERLLAIARGAEASGRPELATLAWQAQRAAVLESASILRPFPERLDEANRNLARLQATKAGAEATRPERAAKLFRQAEARNDDQFPWGALLPVGLFGATFGLVWFARAALGQDGLLYWRKGGWGLLLCLVAAALWALAAFHG